MCVVKTSLQSVRYPDTRLFTAESRSYAGSGYLFVSFVGLAKHDGRGIEDRRHMSRGHSERESFATAGCYRDRGSRYIALDKRCGLKAE